MKGWLLAFVVAQGLDMGTTVVGLRRGGCDELNPILGRTASPTRVVAVKGAATLVVGTIAWGAHKRGHDRYAKVMLGAGIAAGAGAAAWNLHLLHHC